MKTAAETLERLIEVNRQLVLVSLEVSVDVSLQLEPVWGAFAKAVNIARMEINEAQRELGRKESP